jgi:hypothetical protein
LPARWDLGHEANPKNTKSMKEPLDLALQSGPELSSSRWPLAKAVLRVWGERQWEGRKVAEPAKAKWVGLPPRDAVC